MDQTVGENQEHSRTQKNSQHSFRNQRSQGRIKKKRNRPFDQKFKDDDKYTYCFDFCRKNQRHSEGFRSLKTKRLRFLEREGKARTFRQVRYSSKWKFFSFILCEFEPSARETVQISEKQFLTCQKSTATFNVSENFISQGEKRRYLIPWMLTYESDVAMTNKHWLMSQEQND